MILKKLLPLCSFWLQINLFVVLVCCNNNAHFYTSTCTSSTRCDGRYFRTTWKTPIYCFAICIERFWNIDSCSELLQKTRCCARRTVNIAKAVVQQTLNNECTCSHIFVSRNERLRGCARDSWRNTIRTNVTKEKKTYREGERERGGEGGLMYWLRCLLLHW